MPPTKTKAPTKKRFAWQTLSLGLLIAVLLCVIVVHIWDITTIPQGLYQDEAAIGYNAYQIATTGRDEYGRWFPVFFASFNDFKSPVYVYTVALLFRIFGPSVFLLRLTSTLFFGIFLWCVLSYAWQISAPLKERRNLLVLYTAIAGGFLPWLLPLSRVALEVISQSAIVGGIIVLAWLAFAKKSKKNRNRLSIGIGLGALLGLLLYSYATARLIAPMYAAIIALFFFWKNRMAIVAMLSTFFVSVIPLLAYWQMHPEFMDRFRFISILGQDISTWEKVQLFLHNYLAYFSPRFLLFVGDMNPRHGTSTLGTTGSIVALLALIGIFSHLIKITRHKEAFSGFLLTALLCTPIPAALTSEGTPHSLRSMLLGVLLLIVSIEGMRRILSWKKALVTLSLYCVLLLGLVMEFFPYVHDYLFHYAAYSRPQFETWGFIEAMEKAEAIHPKIVQVQHINYANREFTKAVLRWDPSIETQHVDTVVPAPDTCVIYLPNRVEEDVLYSLKGRDIPLNAESLVRLRCYDQ